LFYYFFPALRKHDVEVRKFFVEKSTLNLRVWQSNRKEKFFSSIVSKKEKSFGLPHKIVCVTVYI
jgi:hypothetical protein